MYVHFLFFWVQIKNKIKITCNHLLDFGIHFLPSLYNIRTEGEIDAFMYVIYKYTYMLCISWKAGGFPVSIVLHPKIFQFNIKNNWKLT